ncbi:hypothetical protein [Chryseobacterium kwangjuense]|uniref:Uncharacterized protein n=1 Tax=Chryseobacterium kwangjuense TaxID=267125 RepID=A0A135WKA1_9FLAO|nr:hypothetical protein [Chryseobacterium kwangjuense]KXH85192.1 hypothetical protein AU378_05430 [Chryseobacterium kwangjuense]
MTKEKNVFQKIATGFLLLMMAALFTVIISCREEQDYEITHRVIYKAEGSAGVQIISARYHGYVGANLVSAPNVSGHQWTSPEVTMTHRLPVGKINTEGTLAIIKATGANASSTLKVQIYVDGALKKEVTVTGQDLNAEAQYDIDFKVD